MAEMKTQVEAMTEPIIYPVFGKNKFCRVIPIQTKIKEDTLHHFIIYDPDFVKEFTNEPWDFDGTFDTRPNISDCVQLFTIMGVKEVEIEKQKGKDIEKIRVRKVCTVKVL